jgi:C4-type Zn-finger protein
VAFSTSTAIQFGANYSLGVPAGGSTSLGVTVSEAETVAVAKALGVSAAKAMIAAPKITSPKPKALEKSHTFTVAGTLTAGTNGLPASVIVNAHKATLKAKSASTETYAVRLTLKKGKRTITVIAKDAGGNSAAKKETVTVR